MFLPSFLILALLSLSHAAPKREERQVYVHMDLKGAPPRPAHFMELIGVFHQLGVNGIVIEWEDMFPFTGKLEAIKNGNAYSLQDTMEILEYATSLDMTVIPLIQTLGHMEWVLKTSQYQHLREDPRYPMVLCVGDDEARTLVTDMINQVLEVHSNFPLPFFHIGADEVYQIGICDADKQKLATKFLNDTTRLEFDHLQYIAKNIISQQKDTKVLMWFDELKNSPTELIQEYGLDQLVTPVVWKYGTNLDKDLPTDMWLKLSKSFKSVWGASAFKGADGANKVWNRIKPYAQNNKQWFLQAVKYSAVFPDFHGIIMTGWQRYDHFASLCETFPVSMTSLALNSVILKRYVVVERDVDNIIDILKCPKNTNISNLLSGTDNCRFPGFKIRDAIRAFEKTKLYYDNATWLHNRENGWLQPSHMLLSASNPYNIDVIGRSYASILKKTEQSIQDFGSTFDELYFDDVSREMLTDYVYPFYEQLKTRYAAVQRIDAKPTYRPRPWFTANSMLSH